MGSERKAAEIYCNNVELDSNIKQLDTVLKLQCLFLDIYQCSTYEGDLLYWVKFKPGDETDETASIKIHFKDHESSKPIFSTVEPLNVCSNSPFSMNHMYCPSVFINIYCIYIR